MTPDSHYPHLFHQMILRSGEHALCLVQDFAYVLDAETRELAMQALTYLLKEPAHWPITRQLLLDLAPKMEQAGFRDEWMPFLEHGIYLSHSLDDMQTEAELCYQLGLLNQILAKYEQATTFLTRSAEKFANLYDTLRQTRSLNRASYIARLQRDYLTARQLLDQVYRLLPENDTRLEFCYFVEGMIAIDHKDYQHASLYMQQALSLAQQIGQQRLIALRLGNCGLAFCHQGLYDSAIAYYKQSIDLFGHINDSLQQAQMRMNLANIYLRLHQSQDALELYLLVEQEFRKTNDALHLAMLALNRGIAYRQLQRWSDAELFLRNSCERWQQLQNIYWFVNTLDDLGVVYLEKGELTAAIEIFKQALNKLDTIQSDPGYSELYESLQSHLQQAQFQWNLGCSSFNQE